jgi:drug/metabolite transporter (DMT)-like permease
MDRKTRDTLILVQVCYGLFPWLGKEAMLAFEPRAVLIWRLMAGTVVLGAAAVLRHRRAALPGPRDLLALAGLSVLGISVNQLLFLEGLQRSTAVNAGLIMCLIPVVTCAVALGVKQDALTGRRLTGILVTVSGVAWLFFQRGASVGGDTSLGDLLMTVNCISYSLYLVAAKPVLQRLPKLVVIAWMFLFGLLTAAWFSLDVAWVPEAGVRPWMALAGVLIFPTVLAYLLNTVALARTSASNTAAYVMLQPLLAASLGIGMLGERPEAGLLVTAVAVMVGLWLVSTTGRTAAVAPRSP